MKTFCLRSDKELFSPKRLVWNGPEGIADSDKHTPEALQIKERLQGKEKTDASAEVAGKAKEIVQEIKALKEKVAPLGDSVLGKFQEFLKSKGEIESIDLNKPDDIQAALNEKIKKFNENNINTLRELDNGLDQIMARVELRKELATKLSDVGEKVAIGTKFEEKIRALETNLDEQPSLSQFRNQLEIAHEFKKYSQLVDFTRRYGAISSGGKRGIENAKVIPEIGIAYGAPGNLNYFKYWSEVRPGQALPDVYAIDKRNGRVQKFNWEGQGYGGQAWVFADTPGMEYAEFMSSSYRNRDGSPNTALRALMPKDTDVSAQDLERMTQNQRHERGFIDAATRNYQPTEQEKSIPAAFEQKFNELQRANLEAYQSNTDHPPYGHHLTQMLAYLRSDEYRDTAKRRTATTSPREQTAESAEGSLEKIALALKVNENPEVEQKENHFELKSGKIDADRTLLSFEGVGPGVSLEMDQDKSPSLTIPSYPQPINLFRNYFEVQGGKIDFKRNHPDQPAIEFNVGNEIIIPIKLKKGEQEVAREIKIQIKEKESSPAPAPSETKPSEETTEESTEGVVEPSAITREQREAETRAAAQVAEMEAIAEAARRAAEARASAGAPAKPAESSADSIASPGSSSIADVNSGGGIAGVDSSR